MRGLWLEEGRLSLRDDLPLPALDEGEALVRVRVAGICGTDLALRRGYARFGGIPGHEFVGEIVDAPSAPERAGERVVGEINVSCGSCAACRRSLTTHCEAREVLGIRGRDGAFAEHLRLPLRNLHRVPLELSDEAAVFVEPLAAALQIQEQVAVRPGEAVLVVGAGRLGQLIARSLALTGCELAVVARSERERELLEETGARTLGEVEGGTADLAIEASGSIAGIELACNAAGPRGRVVLKGSYTDPLPAELLESIVLRELSVVGSRCGPFPAAIGALARGEVDPLPLVDGCFPLAEAAAAFDRAAVPGAMKVLLRP